MSQDIPPAPPESEVIRLARLALGMTAEGAAAASRAHGERGISTAYWRDVERGQGGRRGQRVPTRASARALAAMARTVGVTPAELTGAGREDAARVLEEMRRREGVIVPLPTVVVPPRRPLDDGPPLRLHRGADLFPGMSSQVAAEVEPLFRELEARVLRAASAEAARRTEAEGHPVFAQDIIDEVPPGSLIFGEGPQAAAWDRLAARGFTTWQLAQGLSVVQALDPGRHGNTGESAVG